MTLNRYKIGSLITNVDERNKSNEPYEFYGININKEFMPSVANTENVDGSKYKIMRKYRFVFSGMQTGRDNCIRIGIYLNDQPVLVSPAYTTFEVTSKDILPEYFFMIFNSKEKDRYGAFLSDSSVRSNLDWDRFCDIELEVPSIETQKKYVAIYEGLLANLHSYERGLDDLKLTYEALIEKLRREFESKSILDFIEESTEINEGKFGKDYLRGVGKEGFISPKQERTETSLRKCGVFHRGDLVYNPSVLYAGAIALNNDFKNAICTEEYIIIHPKDKNILRSEYLFMWLKRDECGRYIDFKSVDSVRNRVYFKDLEMIEIPIVDIKLQDYAVYVFNAYSFRKETVAILRNLISSICPILIRRSILEAQGGTVNGKKL
jgi:type I restriction enzyme S subunit